MEGDEELAVGQVQRSLLCPFTRKIFEEPVKNKRCGHIYSKQGLVLLSIKYFHLFCCFHSCYNSYLCSSYWKS